MNKFIRIALVAALAAGFVGSQAVYAAVTPNGMKQGLKHGLKNGAKHGLKNGLKSGARNGLKNGAKK